VDPTHDLPGQIVRVLDELEQATDRYALASTEAGVAESAFRLAHSTALIELASSALNVKMTTATREAHAIVRSRHQYERHMIASASADSAKQYLYTLRAKLDALRTLNANVRLLTDPRLPS
jgi:hypothetical protein